MFENFYAGLEPWLVNALGAAIGLSVAAAIVLVAFAIGRWLLLPKEQTVEKNWPPDVSIVRILKWGVVMLLAAVLGKKAWDILGEPLAKQLKSVIDEKFGEAKLPPPAPTEGQTRG